MSVEKGNYIELTAEVPSDKKQNGIYHFFLKILLAPSY